MKVIQNLKPVLEKSENVSIDRKKLGEYAKLFDKKNYKHWLSISPFDFNQLNENEQLEFLFTLNSISFSYWGNPKWRTKHDGKDYDGAQAMMTCLGEAIERGISFNPNQLANFQRADLEEILMGNVEIPLLDKRLSFLREVGVIIQRDFRGDFRYLIDQSQGDALQLVDLLVGNFPSFEDSAVYKGDRIYFSKRAQLLVSDLGYLFGGLDNLDRLSACADYKLPQILRRHSILKYSNELQRKINTKEEIPAGSEEEVEIRAHTIQAVELLKREITDITSNQINDYLWLEGQVKLPSDESYHLTRTTAY